MRQSRLWLLLPLLMMVMLILSLPLSSTSVAGGTATTSMVSIGLDNQPANAESRVSTISDNGLFVAFQSAASNLITGGQDTNGVNDIFVRDLVLGTTERVSLSSSGVEGNAASIAPSLSRTGRYVAFSSDATNLVPSDTNGDSDIFVYDRDLNTIERVSVISGGGQADGGDSVQPFITPDGNLVVFASEAVNLVTGDTNVKQDVFLHNRTTHVTERVSLPNGTEGQANESSFQPKASSDGRYIVFASAASNLVTGDVVICGGVSCTDVFVRDRVLNTTKIASISTGASGTQGDQGSELADISGDGRYVVFESQAANLVPNDTNEFYDLFLRDLVAETTVRFSVNPTTQVEGNDWSRRPQISTDGRWIAFHSWTDNLAPGDTTFGFPDVLRYDRETNTMEKVSVATGGEEGDFDSRDASIAEGGQYISFTSQAANLVPGDTNVLGDVFLRNFLGGFPTPTPTNTPTNTATGTVTSPTSTSTNTATPGTGTPTSTPCPGCPPTFTPTATGTPPTATRTATATRTGTSIAGPGGVFLPIIQKR